MSISSSSSSSSEELRDIVVEKLKKKRKKRTHNHRSEKRERSSNRRDKQQQQLVIEDRGNDDSSENSDSQQSITSSENNERRKRKKKQKKKKQTKRSCNDDEGSKKDKHQHHDPTSFSCKYSGLMSQLYNLLSSHPDLATELPYFLIKMCSGASIDISQIPDQSLSSKLSDIFTTLGCTRKGHGEFIFDDNGRWKKPTNGKDGDEQALVLVKLVKFLMNENGMTMEAIEEHEFKEKEEEANIVVVGGGGKAVIDDNKHNARLNQQDGISSLVIMLLDTFQPSQKSESSLAKELCSIMNMILDGEIICLDGLEDLSLRQSIEKLFAIIGLVKEEMEEEEEEEEEEQIDVVEQGKKVKNDISYGYVLPDNDNENDGIDSTTTATTTGIKEKLMNCIKATQLCHHKFVQQKETNSTTPNKKRKTIGPYLPTTSANGATFDNNNNNHNDESDESEDDGPAPFGSESQVAKARRMKSRAPPISQDDVINTTTHSSTKREEWMMVPGEHDFLKGVMSSGGMMKNRKFKNEKNRQLPQQPTEEQIMNPEIRREVDSIMDAHKAARGPSLVEQHREQIAQEKAAKAKGKGGSNWNWSKKDLDAGRRVDKNYLHMVMGGATTDLKNKFQGSYSKGFT